MNNITCADLPVHSEQTTLPAPTTTLSSYVNLDKFSSSQLSNYTTVGKDATT